MTPFTVEAERGASGKVWVLQAVEAPGAISEVRSLSQVDEYMREAIHIVTDIPIAEIEIRLVPVLPAHVQDDLRRAHDLRQAAIQANADAARARATAAKSLHDEGVTVRDIGRVLDVSFQRAQQLVSSAN